MQPQRQKKKSRKWIGSLIVLLLIGVGTAAYFKLPALGKDNKADPNAQAITVMRSSIEDVVTSQGTLEPKEYVDVGAQVSGQLKKLYVELGQDVKQGDPIADIDAEIYETKVQGEQANLKTLNAQKAEQAAKVVQAKQKVERNKKLVDVQAMSVEAYQDTITDQKVAQAQLNSIDAQIEQATSTLKGDMTNLNYTKIYAPMTGTVVSQSAREGQTLNANQTTPTIVQLANLDVMTVKAQVAEADIPKIQPGMDVYFTILGSQDRKWTAKVDQILPTPETINDVVLYDVLVDVDNKDRQLMSGMSTQMFFVLGSADSALTIPTSYLTQKVAAKENTYKIDVLKNGNVEQREVTIGMQDRTKAQVTAGLEEGDKIMVPSADTGKTGTGSTKAMRSMGPRL